MQLPALTLNLIHVWRLSISRAPIDELHALLDDAERNRADRFAFTRDRNRFVAVRGWLRRLLAGYVNVAPHELQFRYGPQGKPALAGRGHGLDVRFNVSHSHDAALLAFTVDREIGVDVEHARDLPDLERLAHASFSEEECGRVLASPPAQRVEMFYRYWTSKEACVKARGGGLSISLQEFTVDLHPDATSWGVRTPAGAPLFPRVQSLPVPEGYAGAIAADGSDWGVSLLDLP